jgi:phosphoadenylyl-sulfate reductase (thioredoxin)
VSNTQSHISNVREALLAQDPALLEELNTMEAEDLIRWSYENFGDRVGIITSFQDTGCVMIDIASRVTPDMRVLTVDTLRLHKETYALMSEIEKKYNLEIEQYMPEAKRLQGMVAQHGEFLFFDSKAKQEYCCQIRKVEPNIRALQTIDVWITGLRQDHSENRGDTPKAQYSENEWNTLLKLAPLADWDANRMTAYTDEHEVPHNALYDQGYTSIGCHTCSTPTLPHEDKRAGRWRWFNAMDPDANKECGIHSNTGGSGI